MSAGAAGVTGQQHAQEFVLECFLRLRRLPSRTTNNGGGGLRREFNIARKPLRAIATVVLGATNT